MNSTETHPPHKRERRKEARPGELLDAALDLFVEKGFAATRSEEVAARAGVCKGTLFLYFPSKEELFKAVVRENMVRHQTEGAEEIARFEGPTAALLQYLMLEWWRRYGATKASGISKLVMSEASNFPDLARFFQEEVVTPGHAMIRSVLQRGIERGEFRPVDMDLTVHSVLAPLLFLVTWKHSMAPCCPSSQQIDPETFIRHHTELLVRGLSV
ncbi:MAG: TetR/AcrR family transcriptional regulator [Limnohabitans sp.]|jgi:TetR/AcrR family transcriptional regulator|nr:MAG: TetR/AcrR family transcriptional regulator [Limnohabitans sp.]